MPEQLTLPIATHMIATGLEYDREHPERGVYQVWAECDSHGHVLRWLREPVYTTEEWEAATGWPHPETEKAS